MKKNKTESEQYKLVSERLKPGVVIKNYQELCKILELEKKTGNAKISQLRELERFFSFEKEGQKFIIKKIFDSPLSKSDKRLVYVTLIETLLLDFFISEDRTTIKVTKNKLWQRLGMINQNYVKGERSSALMNYLKSSDEVIENGWQVYQWHVDKAYQNSRKKLNETTKRAMKSLINRKLIQACDSVIMAVPIDKDRAIEIRNDETIEKILACEKAALNDLGCANINEVLYGRKLKKYFEIRNERLRNLGYGYIFRVYKIICNRKYLRQAKEENIRKLKEELNNKLIEFLFRQADKDYEKNVADLQNGKTEFKYQDYYTEVQRLIITKILKLGENDITDFIESVELNNEIRDGIDDQLPI